MGSRTQNLNLFCKSHGLKFPTFTFSHNTYTGYVCKLTWYNTVEISSNFSTSKEESIKTCVDKLSKWASVEENFISLISASMRSNEDNGMMV